MNHMNVLHGEVGERDFFFPALKKTGMGVREGLFTRWKAQYYLLTVLFHGFSHLPKTSAYLPHGVMKE